MMTKNTSLRWVILATARIILIPVFIGVGISAYIVMIQESH